MCCYNAAQSPPITPGSVRSACHQPFSSCRPQMLLLTDDNQISRRNGRWFAVSPYLRARDPPLSSFPCLFPVILPSFLSLPFSLFLFFLFLSLFPFPLFLVFVFFFFFPVSLSAVPCRCHPQGREEADLGRGNGFTYRCLHSLAQTVCGIDRIPLLLFLALADGYSCRWHLYCWIKRK